MTTTTERYTAEQVAIMVEDRALPPLDWRNLAAATIRSCNTRLKSLEAENARLRALVKAAYEEGVEDGAREAMSGERGFGDFFAEWDESNARNALKED